MLSSVTFADVSDEARQSITQAYHKACKAAEIKFLPGMFCFRHSSFKAFGPDGREINLLGQEIAVKNLLDNSLSAKEHTRILELSTGQNATVVALVEDVLQLEFVERVGGTPQLKTLKTRSRDTWSLTILGWRQMESRIIEQKMEEDEES